MNNKILLFVLCIIFSGISLAQTNPTPQILPYKFTTLADSVLPAGMAMHKFATLITSKIVTAGTANLPYIAGAISGGWNNQATKGIGILASGTNPAGAMVVAINTVGKTNITTSWKVTTVSNAASTRDNSISLQYRVGATGDFTDIGSTTYSSTSTAAGDSLIFSQKLPAGAEGKDTVQVRWLYWESAGTTGARDRLAITNINIAVPAAPCNAPTAQPVNIVFGTVTDVAISGSFTAASPIADEYLVVMSSNNALTSSPIDGQLYVAGDGLGDGAVVSKSNSLNFSVASLSPSSTYYFFIFAINSACSGGPKYLITNPPTKSASTTAGLPLCAAPAAQPSNLTFSNVTVNSLQGQFTATTADEYVVLQSLSSTLTNNPANGTIYSLGDIIGNATVIQRNSTILFDAISLSPNTTYYYFVFSINSFNCAGGPFYSTISPLNNSQATLPLPSCTTPSSQALNLILKPSNNAIVINYNAANNADHYLIIQTTSATLTAQPIDNQDYIIGDNIGGGKVIANTSTTSTIASNLLPSTTYYLFIYAVNKNCTNGPKYLSALPLNGNTTTNNTPLNNVYFGTLHTHSDYSDGNKDLPGYTPAQDYDYAIKANCLDYLGISEHNHFSSTDNPGNIITNYHQGSTQADNFTAAHPNFVALYGMEWGTISGGGHVVIYGDGMDKLFGWETNVGGITGNNYDVLVAKGDYTGTSGLFKTINDNIGTNTFATLAHPNTADFNGIAGTYNAIADDAVVGSAVESGPAFSTNTTYGDPASSLSYLSYFTKLLAKGYHVGPTVDHDNHNTTFGRTTFARTAIIAPSLSKTEIVKAMKNMHFYTTQDCDSKVDFTINTKIMGSIFTDNNAPVIAVNLTDATTPTASAVIKIMYGIPGSGVVATEIFSTNGNSLNYTDNKLPNLATGYYYADITNNASRIITSPIWYTRNDASVLPVKLKWFDVQKLKSSVLIYWNTTQETNSNYFIVQHSTDGKNWINAAKKNAAGTSNSSISYEVKDNAPKPGINFYRLMQVDKNGTTEFSTIKTVVFAESNEILITPNPAKDFVTIYFSKNNTNQNKITLFSANGLLIKEFTTSEQYYKINTASLSKGIYFIKVLNGEKLTAQKLLIF